MSLRIRRLQILVITERARFGLSMRFEDGLNVISAPNTSGKSTALMSILYALGLEGMLGPSHQPPLPDAMRRSIMDGDVEIPVVESKVRVEIENQQGQRFVAQRLVQGTGDPNQRQLIHGTHGPIISEPNGQYESRDYYVRTGGAAQERSGFHRFLAEFVGYDLPRVPAIENESVPLYLECLFPYFFVDQMTGWRDIKARMPTYLRIPEMSKRSAEFIMSLDILRRAIEKQEYERRQTALREKWAVLVRQAKAETGVSQVIIRGLPDEPAAAWPPTPAPELFITDGTNWTPLANAIERLDARLAQIQNEDLPQAEQVSQSVIEELRRAEEELNRFAEKLESTTRDLMGERAHRDSVFKRLQALAEDYRQYLDAKKVEDRGGEGEVPLETADHACPTCHRPIEDTLLDQEHSTPPMTLEQNIVFIRDQMATFRDMRQDAEGVVEAKERQVQAIERRISDTNAMVRALKHTLHSDGRVPSAAAIQEKLQIEQRVILLHAVKDKFAEFLTKFEELATEWIHIQSRLKALATISLSDMDDKKLSHLGKTFVEQVRLYGFSSFPVEQIGISKESYRPARGEYDIGLTSASDTIRIIWAYLLSMLETDRKFTTNHLGLLMFDEPRQQGTKTLSFDALLKRAAESRHSKQQVIVATSEDRDILDGILANVPCNYMKYDGKMLRPTTP